MSVTTAAVWAERAIEAEIAIHKLMTGSRVVELTGPDGTRVQYQEADLRKLQDYLGFCESKTQQASSSAGKPVYILP